MLIFSIFCIFPKLRVTSNYNKRRLYVKQTQESFAILSVAIKNRILFYG